MQIYFSFCARTTHILNFLVNCVNPFYNESTGFDRFQRICRPEVVYVWAKNRGDYLIWEFMTCGTVKPPVTRHKYYFVNYRSQVLLKIFFYRLNLFSDHENDLSCLKNFIFCLNYATLIRLVNTFLLTKCYCELWFT